MTRKVPFVPTVVVLVAVAIMIALGIWQLGRADEKAALLASYAAAQEQEGYSFIWPNVPEAAYTRTRVYCTEPGVPKVIAGRSAQGQSGWAHVARCTMGGPWPNEPVEDRMPDHFLRPLDVVIGWSRAPDPVAWSGGEVSGTVVPTGELGYKLVADPPLVGLEANAKPDPNDLPNNHLSYAVQWFLFALTALVIYGLALRGRWRDRQPGRS